MSSRGSKALNGHVTTTEYNTKFTYSNGAKVLEGNNGLHSLPDFSHSSNAVYIKLKQNGELHEMRFYNNKGELEIEIAFHPEPNISKTKQKINVLHYHTFNNLKRSKALPLTKEIKQKYKVYLKEFNLYD